MRLRWIIWGWPLCILLFTLAVTLIAFVFPDSGARPAVIMAFLFVIPGMAVVRFFLIEDIAIELMLAIALRWAMVAKEHLKFFNRFLFQWRGRTTGTCTSCSDSRSPTRYLER